MNAEMKPLVFNYTRHIEALAEIERLKQEIIELRAERDALLKPKGNRGMRYEK